MTSAVAHPGVRRHPARNQIAARQPLPFGWREFVTGVALIVVTGASIGLMISVIYHRISFTPVLSASMEPTFGPGDLIVTEAESASDIKVGQVIALPVPGAPGQRYVHRVISVTMKDGKPLVRTKGDANPAPESFTLRVDSPYVPRVIASVPDVGKLSQLLQHGALRLAVIAMTLLCALVAAKRLIWSVRSDDTPTTDDHEDNR